MSAAWRTTKAIWTSRIGFEPSHSAIFEVQRSPCRISILLAAVLQPTILQHSKKCDCVVGREHVIFNAYLKRIKKILEVCWCPACGNLQTCAMVRRTPCGWCPSPGLAPVQPCSRARPSPQHWTWRRHCTARRVCRCGAAAVGAHGSSAAPCLRPVMSHNSVSWNNIHIVVRNIPRSRSRNHPTDIEPTKPTKAASTRMPISSLARLRSYQGYEGYEGHEGYYQEWQSRLSRLPRMITKSIKAMPAQRHRTTVRTRHRRRVHWCDCVVSVSKQARKGVAHSNPIHPISSSRFIGTPHPTIPCPRAIRPATHTSHAFAASEQSRSVLQSLAPRDRLSRHSGNTGRMVGKSWKRSRKPGAGRMALARCRSDETAKKQ